MTAACVGGTGTVVSSGLVGSISQPTVMSAAPAPVHKTVTVLAASSIGTAAKVKTITLFCNGRFKRSGQQGLTTLCLTLEIADRGRIANDAFTLNSLDAFF